MSEIENAAERVMATMRALDAHRHESVPTLEREYLRALETYFVVAEKTAGRAAQSDDTDDEASLEEEARAEVVRSDRDSIAGHYAAARRALRLARIYQLEPGSSGRRERECIEAASRHREEVRALRLRMRPVAEQLPLPGLAKARRDAHEAYEPRAVRSA